MPGTLSKLIYIWNILRADRSGRGQKVLSLIRLYQNRVLVDQLHYNLEVHNVYIQKSINLPIEKYNVRMVSEMILAFNCQLRWPDYYLQTHPDKTCYDDAKYPISFILT